jgi:large conductance mechanosensitive channel
MRGSVMDMAVGIIIGAAFGRIVSSFVNDVAMPPIGVLVGGLDFSNLSLALGTTEATVNYGLFINNVIDFLIVAFVIFVVIKGMNSMQRKQEEAPAAPPKPSEEVVLLTEIRDALRRS